MLLGLEAERFDLRAVYAKFHAHEPELAKPAAFRAYRPLLYRDHAEFLRRLTAGVAVAKYPPHEQRAAARELCPFDRDEHRSPIPFWLVPDILASVTGVLQSRAELVTAAAGLACEQFRLKHGRWPRDLAELPEPPPVSPFDARPLVYRVFPDRIAIFCRLADEHLRWVEPPEFEYPEVPGISIGVRVWNPSARAQPPKPPKPDQ
jgi:hypothetical protein